MQNRLRLMLWPALLLALFIAACGTKNVGVNGPTLSGQQQSQREPAGVAVGGFEVIRQNQQGNNDPALNSTIQLALQDNGAVKALVIDVTDSTFTTAVGLDVRYDAARYHPMRTEFTNLLGESSDVLTASFLDTVQGTAGLGAAAISGYTPGPLHGRFATLYFGSGPDRAVSNVAGDAHENPAGVGETLANVGLPNLVVDTSQTDTVSLTWTAAWMIGNGDGNQEVNASDLTPIAQVFKKSTATDFIAVKGDYDRNGEANASDITPVGKYFKRWTDAYLVEASDDDDTGKVTIATLTGGTPDQQKAKTPLATGDLTTVFPYWTLTIDAGSTFTYANLVALDANADAQHLVKFTITPLGQTGKANGVPASTTVTVSGNPPPPQQNNLVVDGFSVEVNDGAATPNPLATLDDTNPSFSVVANATIGFKLKSIKGSFNGAAFDGANPGVFPNGMTQADYDAAFNACVANTIWATSTGGDAAARRSAEWVSFSSGSTPYLGTLPAGGKIFPDYDPESSATDPVPDPEGTLVVTLPTNNGPLPGGGTAIYPDTHTPEPGLKVQILGQPVISTFRIDVTQDLEQATLTPYQDKNGAAIAQLTLNRRNDVYMNNIMWDSLNAPHPGTEPTDLTTVSMELRRIASDGLVTGATIPLGYVKYDPANGMDIADMSTGQFTIINGLPDPNSGDPTYIAVAIVAGSQLVQGGTYAMRMNVAGKFTSINLPADTMTTKDPPPPQPLEVAPALLAEDNDTLQIFYKDAIIRRNGDVKLQFSGPPNPLPLFVPVNQTAFDDILRTGNTTGSLPAAEYSPNIDYTNTPPDPQTDYYPRVVIKNDANGAITDMDDPGQEVTPVISRGAGRLVVSTASITPGGGDPGSPPIKYNIAVYDQGGIPLGTGQFTFQPGSAGFTISPGDLHWGVNIFNREDRDFADMIFDEGTVPEVHTVDGTNLNNAAFPVPVLFFEFYGGAMFDWNQDENKTEGPHAPSSPNAYVFVHGVNTNRDMDMVMGLRVTGIAPNGDYLCIHTLGLGDFIKPGTPGWNGVLDPGEDYQLTLEDTWSNSSTPFTELLHVTGNNPNF
jgi:hypothetical protein